MRYRPALALAAAAALCGFTAAPAPYSKPAALLPSVPLIASKRRSRNRFGSNGSHTYPSNGARECERRMRQIARGSLRFENGLRSAR